MDQAQTQIRKSTPVKGSSFTGMGDVPEFTIGEETVSASPTEARLEKRLRKLELLLEVYDIPLPPWRD